MKQTQPLPADRADDFSSAQGNVNLGGRINLFPTPAGEDAAQKIGRCVAFMEQNVNRPLQVAALAAQARLSPSHFFALFKRHTGCPPMDYFTRLRMRRACRLLASTSASVKEAAAALGYDDPFYFSRVFKAVNKVAPSVYRRSARAAHAASDQNQMATGLFAGTEMPPPGSGHAGISRTLKTSGQRRKQFEQTTFAAKNPVKTVGAIRQMAYCLRQSQPAKC